MTTRRRFLAGLLALVAWPGSVALPSRAAATGRFHLVDGWVLTDADLEWLARHDP